MLIVVSLYFWGDGLDPDAITKALGIVPTQSASKGQERKTCTGATVINHTGLWCFSTDSLSASSMLDDHVDVLMQILPKENVFLLNRFSGVDDACVDVFISDIELNDANSGCEFEVSPSRLEFLSQIGLPVRFSIPFPASDSGDKGPGSNIDQGR